MSTPNTRSRSQNRDKNEQEPPQTKSEPSPRHSSDDDTTPEKPEWQRETISQPPINTTEISSLISSFQTSIHHLTQSIQALRVETQDNLHLLHQRLEQQEQTQHDLSMELQMLRTSDVKEKEAEHPQIQIEPTSTSTDVRITSTAPTSTNVTVKKEELPKMPIKMKEFSGQDKDQNIQSWVDQLTTIKRIQNWSDDIIIKHCAMLLSESAQRWYLQTGHLMTENWKKFSKELIKRFTLNINPWMATRYTETIKQKVNETCRDFMDRVQRELRSINIDSEERVCEVFLNGARDSIASGIIRSIGREAVESKELVEIASRLEMAERMERDSNKRQIERTTTRQGTALIPSSNAAYNSGARLQLVRGDCFICRDNAPCT